MYDFGFDDVSRFNEIAFYGAVYLIEFRDYTRALVLTDGSIDESFVIEEES